MLGIRKTKLQNQTLTPVLINNLVDTKENTPTPPKKVRILPWIILGLVVSLILAGIGTLVWKLIQFGNRPDLVINAPSDIDQSSTPTPLPKGIITLVSQDILFEPEPYRNELAKFEINVPFGWQVDDSGKSGTVVVLVDPKVTMASGSAILTFISVSTASSRGTLDDEVKSIKEGFVKIYDSFTIEEDKEMFLAGKTYYLFGGVYNANDVKMKNRTLILIYNGRGYAISASAPESIWSTKEMLINASMFSFKNI